MHSARTSTHEHGACLDCALALRVGRGLVPPRGERTCKPAWRVPLRGWPERAAEGVMDAAQRGLVPEEVRGLRIQQNVSCTGCASTMKGAPVRPYLPQRRVQESAAVCGGLGCPRLHQQDPEHRMCTVHMEYESMRGGRMGVPARWIAARLRCDETKAASSPGGLQWFTTHVGRCIAWCTCSSWQDRHGPLQAPFVLEVLMCMTLCTWTDLLVAAAAHSCAVPWSHQPVSQCG